jgi:hypothetical protein
MFKLLYNFWLIAFKLLNNNTFFYKNIVFYAKNFNELSFFKKLLVILFHDDLFEKNLNVINYRRKWYPLIHTFHISFYNKNTFKKFSLKEFNKELNFIKGNLSENGFITNLFNQNVVFNFFFLKKLFSKHFYTFFEENSSVKINFLMSQILETNKNKFNSYKLYNLNFYSHWYKYNFDNNQFVFPQLHLNNLHKSFNLRVSKTIDNFYFNKDVRNINLISLNSDFSNRLSSLSPINFSESSTNKFIDLNNLKNYCFFFLRKNKIFNKGRYSRNRQLYRTGFYWCLYFNIISVYGLYFLFYRVVFNFGYLWFFLIVFFGSFIFSRMLKYNYFNINFVVSEISKSFTWFSFLLRNITLSYNNIITFFLTKLSVFNKIGAGYGFNTSLSTLTKLTVNHDSFKFSFFWKSLNKSDTSFLKINSIFHYLTQLPLFFKSK